MITKKFIPDSDEDLFASSQELPDQVLSPVQEAVHEHELEKDVEEEVDTSQWLFVTTGLTANDRNVVDCFIRSLSCLGLASSLDGRVTHIITGTKATQHGYEAQRTLKYLKGVARGLWVVTADWAAACLRDRDPTSASILKCKQAS